MSKKRQESHDADNSYADGLRRMIEGIRAIADDIPQALIDQLKPDERMAIPAGKGRYP